MVSPPIKLLRPITWESSAFSFPDPLHLSSLYPFEFCIQNVNGICPLFSVPSASHSCSNHPYLTETVKTFYLVSAPVSSLPLPPLIPHLANISNLLLSDYVSSWLRILQWLPLCPRNGTRSSTPVVFSFLGSAHLFSIWGLFSRSFLYTLFFSLLCIS